MDESLIIQLAIEEIRLKTIAVTEQLLEVVELEYKDDAPVVAAVHDDYEENTASVYFSVKGQRFYFAVYLDLLPEPKVKWTNTDTMWHVYFSATSEEMNLDQLAAMTVIPVTAGWNKGDKKRHGNSLYAFSRLNIDPFPGPGDFDRKIGLLLDLLEQDKEGILKLVKEAHGYIQMAVYYHNATGMIGGCHITKELMIRLVALGLDVDIDQYVGGKSVKR